MVVLAAELRREDRGEQILGAHALEAAARCLPPCQRSSASERVAFQRQRVSNMGACSAAWISSSSSPLGLQHLEDRLEREAVLRAEREQDAVVGGRGLQLEVEAAAEALAQRQAPGAVDAAAEGRVDDELHAARLVEEALGDHGRRGWAPRRAPRAPAAT